MKNEVIKFEAGGKEYGAIFNINVMEEIQTEYGSLEEWGARTDANADGVDVKALLYGFQCMINEARDIEAAEAGTSAETLTRKQTGRILTAYGLENAAELLNKIVTGGTDAGKNA